MRIEISDDERKRIKKQKRINEYIEKIKISRDPLDNNTFWIHSGSSSKVYMVYFSIQKQKFLCDCMHFALKQTDCIHITTIKFYIKFFVYAQTSEQVKRTEKPITRLQTFSSRENLVRDKLIE